MIGNLDLDIKNYSVRDLERFFQLDSLTNYTETDVEIKEKEIFNKFTSKGSPDPLLKRNLSEFLGLGRQWLINSKNKIVTAEEQPGMVTIGKPLVYTQPTSFAYTNPSEYFPGNLNPIEKHLVTKLVCIDSLFRVDYGRTRSTDFMFKLPDQINNVGSMQLVSLELPRMWYDFSSELNNNTMIIELYNMVGYPDSVHKVVVPDGNYTSDSFENKMNNYFHNVGNGLNFLHITVDPNTSNTIIRARNIVDGGSDPIPYDSTNVYYSPGFYFVVNFETKNDALYKNLGWMMGFRKNKYVVTIENSYEDNIYNGNNSVYFEGYLQSESSYGSTIDNYIFVEIDDYNRNFLTDSIVSANSYDTFIGKNIMARIALTSGSYTIVENTSADKIFKKREYFGPVKIEKLTIRLLNRFGKVINLNCNDYSLVLEFKQIY